MTEESDAILNAIRAEIAENTADAPTVPGLYRMPCGECFVDYWIGLDGAEHWAVPGDPASYTRRSIALARHGEAGWQRMYTLAEASELLGMSGGRSTGDPSRA
ncbi:hypothetical protein [Microbacterium flavum]|jgi:hypothetical protein|uniref:hypothetical protein n=1 Tax=Microbacterium flavum TaxID=415216 RepID=UPI0024ACF0BB|nr:hypothetical protein [Microbacterium flavum]